MRIELRQIKLWQTRSFKGYGFQNGVAVEDDGSSREVTVDKRKYFETEFHPVDGARPYIKLRYESLDRLGRIAGYLPRRQLPNNIPIDQAPSTPLSIRMK